MDMTYSVTENTLRDESPIPCDDETNFTFDSCFNDAIYKVCNKYFCAFSKGNMHDLHKVFLVEVYGSSLGWIEI